MRLFRRFLNAIWPRRGAELVVYDSLGRVVRDPIKQAALLDEMSGRRAEVYGADGVLLADSRAEKRA